VGSGRGKSRRAQAVAVPSSQATSGATWDVNEWRKFVIDRGINQVSLYEYYLGREHDINCDDSEYSKVAQELFCDAVEVGAITLPANYDADDFLLEVNDGSSTNISLSNASGDTESTRYPFSGRDNANAVHAMLEQDLTHWFLNEITQRIANLLGTTGHAILQPVGPDWRGKNVVLTGQFSWTRTEIENELRAAGAKIGSSVSGKTDVVLVGKSPGIKLRKAQARGIPTLHGDVDIHDLMA
jgi:hypothetical protein